MLFSNRASLIYNGGFAQSNQAFGELLTPITLLKNSSQSFYRQGDTIQYEITVSNSSFVTYDGLVLTDNLGSYDFGGSARFPLLYIENTAGLTYYGASGFSTGLVMTAPVPEGVQFTFDLPPQTVAVIRYETSLTAFAPLAANAQIVNIAVLSGTAPFLPLSSTVTLSAAAVPSLVLTKCIEKNATPGSIYTMKFILSNYGNTPVNSDDYVVLSDQLQPQLENISVQGNGVLWTQDEQYYYDEGLAFFQTTVGAITIKSADFTQDDFGRWISSPSSMEIIITGTVKTQV